MADRTDTQRLDWLQSLLRSRGDIRQIIDFAENDLELKEEFYEAARTLQEAHFARSLQSMKGAA